MDICIIKEQLPQSSFFCLSPFCSDKNNRKFGNQDRHLLREQCKKWIVEDQKLSVSHQPLQNKAINNLQFDFHHRPLQAFELLSRLRVSDWRKVLDAQQTKTKKEIVRAVEVEFQTIREKLEELLDNAAFFDKACQLVKAHEDPSVPLNNYYDQNLTSLNALHSKVLFKRMELKEIIGEIKLQIQKIFESIIQDQSENNGLISHQEQRNFHEFVFEPTQEYFNKIQVLASALKKSVPLFRSEDDQLVLECCLCQGTIRSILDSSNKKTIKKYLAEQMLTHIYCRHYNQAAFAYTHKISKSYLIPITFQEFLSESRKCTHIIIVDRDSGVLFQQQFCDVRKGQRRMSVEVVSIKNVAMAREKHILIENHHSAEYLISIMAYVCTQRDQNVQILTNRPTLKKGIEDLLECRTKQEGKSNTKQEIKNE